MEIKFKNKKRYGGGFTIVELVIVIAVIGILSAILIPTFVGLVNKASVSADVMTVKNINTQLKISEETNGKPETFSQMLSAASEAGYDVNKLNPTTDGYSIVWDMSQNLLFLYDKDGNLADNQAETPSENKSDLWSMTTETPAENLAENSIAGNVYLNNDSVESVTVSYGIEVSGETDVNFTTTNSGTYNVVLNGGNLTVNAENATVNSYGAKNQVTVTAVDMNNSYHEFGTVNGNVYLKKGHLSIENNSHVYAVVITATSVNDVKVDVKNSSSIETGVAATSSEVSSALVNNSNFNIPEDKKVTEVIDSETASKYAGGFGTETSPYLIATSAQIININGNAENKVYYKLSNDIDLDAPESGCNIVYNEHIENISLDGNGYKIELPTLDDDFGQPCFIFYELYSSEIKNININYNGSHTSLANEARNTTFSNLTLTGNANFDIYQGFGLLTYFASEKVDVINCNNYATINSTWGLTSVYIGYPYSNLNLSFENCTNYANGTAQSISLFVGNPSNPYTLSVKNCFNYGILTSTNPSSSYSEVAAVLNSNLTKLVVDDVTWRENSTNNEYYNSNYFGNCVYMKDESLKITKNEDNTFTINKSSNNSIAKYRIVLSTYFNWSSDDGSKGTKLISVVYEFDSSSFDENGTFTTTDFKYLQFTLNSNLEQTDLIFDGTLNYILEDNVIPVVTDGINYYYYVDENFEDLTLSLSQDPANISSCDLLALDNNGNIIYTTSLSN